VSNAPWPRRGRGQQRWRGWLALAIGIAVLFFAPMLARAQAPADTVRLQWTAPGDDGTIGTASVYDLRVSTSPIDLSNWSSASQVTGLPAPLAAGTKQGVTVSGLTRGTTYYFAVRTEDDAGNWSGLSNVFRWDWITDTSPPAAPGGVTATRESGNVHVHWSPNSEPDLQGYTVYRSTTAGGTYSPLNGTLLSTTDYFDANLPAGATALYYKVTATDQSFNESARSATASVSFVSGGPATGDWAIETGYPNPSPVTSPVTFAIVIPAAGGAGGSLVIMDAGGHRVREMPLASQATGRQLVVWDGKNDSGRDVAPGVYRALVMAGGQRSSTRLVRIP